MTLCMYMLDYIESFMWYRSGPYCTSTTA